MKHRHCVPCTVFEGKIVVTGGKFCEQFGNNHYYTAGLKSVQAYWNHQNKWSQFPDLLKERRDHGSVSMGNDVEENCSISESHTKLQSSYEFSCAKILIISILGI